MNAESPAGSMAAVPGDVVQGAACGEHRQGSPVGDRHVVEGVATHDAHGRATRQPVARVPTTCSWVRDVAAVQRETSRRA